MHETIPGVVCPFTGNSNLQRPDMRMTTSTGRIDAGDYIVWYFPDTAKRTRDEKLTMLLGEWGKDEAKAADAIKLLMAEEHIIAVRDTEDKLWHFVKVPKMPFPPTLADVILGNWK